MNLETALRYYPISEKFYPSRRTFWTERPGWATCRRHREDNASAEHGKPSFTRRRCAASVGRVALWAHLQPTCAIPSARFRLYPHDVGIGTGATSIV